MGSFKLEPMSLKFDIENLVKSCLNIFKRAGVSLEVILDPSGPFESYMHSPHLL
jgi:hypothetical protein